MGCRHWHPKSWGRVWESGPGAATELLPRPWESWNNLILSQKGWCCAGVMCPPHTPPPSPPEQKTIASSYLRKSHDKYIWILRSVLTNYTKVVPTPFTVFSFWLSLEPVFQSEKYGFVLQVSYSCVWGDIYLVAMFWVAPHSSLSYSPHFGLCFGGDPAHMGSPVRVGT